MVLRIAKVAEVVGSELVPLAKLGPRLNELATIITSLESADPQGPIWNLELVIGAGTTERKVTIKLAGFLTPDQYHKSQHEPFIIITEPALIIFRNRVFLSERKIRTDTEREEVVLRAKKIVFDEEAEVTSLRSFVSNIDAATEYQQSGPKRDPISDDVKLLVWSRDGGACVRCGSKEKIHFDHVLPVAKGGSNEPANIQILCQSCNLRKSDKIAFS
ncbi:MAG: HNH endonuclease [Proteobacteria bacterium]|nr:HNH endonuclease [Pseudomonadota bacterium]